MAFIKYALPALAAAQVVFAADCGESGKTIKIASQGDADSYNTCRTLKGDVAVDKSISGTLILNGIESIEGSLTCDGGANLTSFGAPSLETIDKGFNLNGVTSLTDLSFPALTSVGSIDFEAVPMLQAFGFTEGIKTAGDVSIVNTGLTTLDGISLNAVGKFWIADNSQLKTVNVNNLKNATNLINFSGNLDSLEISLPNLVSGTNMTFRNVSSVSIPSLNKLGGQLGFWGNGFEEFSAENLTETGDLVFNENKQLSNISMPNLQKVNGGFLITKNDELKAIDFASLAQVSGAIDFAGNFDKASLPALDNVRGGFNMQSTGNFSCSEFDKLEGSVIHGDYKCKGDLNNPKTQDGSSGSTTGGDGSDDPKDDSAALYGVHAPTLALAALFGLLVQYVL